MTHFRPPNVHHRPARTHPRPERAHPKPDSGPRKITWVKHDKFPLFVRGPPQPGGHPSFIPTWRGASRALAASLLYSNAWRCKIHKGFSKGFGLPTGCISIVCHYSLSSMVDVRSDWLCHVSPASDRPLEKLKRWEDGTDFHSIQTVQLHNPALSALSRTLAAKWRSKAFLDTHIMHTFIWKLRSRPMSMRVKNPDTVFFTFHALGMVLQTALFPKSRKVLLSF